MSVQATGSKGNHVTFLIELEDQRFFFRADDGQGEDDYLEAERAVMDLVRPRGVPVPVILTRIHPRPGIPFDTNCWNMSRASPSTNTTRKGRWKRKPWPARPGGTSPHFTKFRSTGLAF